MTERVADLQADVEEVLLSEEQIAAKVTELGRQISDAYAGRQLTEPRVARVDENSFAVARVKLAAGFRLVDFGDIAQLRAALGPSTAAFLVEPIQAEAGIIMPPDGYLAAARALCRERNVLFVLDEIQTGLGRTGKLFAYEHEPGAEPDLLILGKALGGGVYPVSAVLASRAIMTLLKPGDHGSTFGGNPLASAVGAAALDVLVDERLTERAADLGAHLRAALATLRSNKIASVRGRGLLIGVEIAATAGTARKYCEQLLERGVLAKDTHAQVIRLAPPLVIERAELDWLVAQLRVVLQC